MKHFSLLTVNTIKRSGFLDANKKGRKKIYLSGTMAEDLAIWCMETSSDIFILSLASACVLTLTILCCFLLPQRMDPPGCDTEFRDATAATAVGPTIVRDHQKALYHMVKFSIRLKRKLKKIREQEQQQSVIVNNT
jgi:hypothetical protein